MLQQTTNKQIPDNFPLHYFAAAVIFISCTPKSPYMRKRLVRSLIFLSLGIALHTAADAQQTIKWKYRDRDFVQPNTWSLGMTLGVTDLWGDVGTQGILDHYNNGTYTKNIKFMGGMYGRYTAHPALALRLGFSFGTLYASDDWNFEKAKKATSIEDDAYQRYLRNQKVKTLLWTGDFLFEFNPLRMNVDMDKVRRRRFQPILMAGVGGFYMTPKAEYVNRVTGQKKWQNIYNLHLEGDGFVGYETAPKKYSRLQLSVPMGFGVRWDVGKYLGLGVEYLYHYTFTDYLDGVSDRYIDPALFDANLDPKNAAIAKDIYDRSWIIDPNAKHNPGDLRGNKSVNDGFSTISINFYYKVKSKRIPWWYQ